MARSASSVRTLLARHWLDRVGTARPAWAPHLAPSDVQACLLRRAAADADPDRAAALAGPLTKEPSAEDRRWLRRRLDDDSCWALVEALATAADALAVAIGGLIVDEGLPGVPGRASERACTVVAAFHREHARVPTAEDLAEEAPRFVAAIRERVARTKDKYPVAEFTRRLAPVYRQRWAELGDAALAVARPSDLGVGWRDCPPMSGAGNGWLVGTDRSVRSRYRYHLRTGWATTLDAEGVENAEYIDRRVARMSADELGILVVERACAPIGLRLRPLRELVRSFSRGVELADLETAHDGAGPPVDRTLREWAAAGTALPDRLDEHLVDAVKRQAENWARWSSDARWMVDGLAARNGSWAGQIRMATARKLWHTAHNREAQWEVPFTRAEVARLLPKMFRSHLTEVIRSPIGAPDRQGVDPGQVAQLAELLTRNPDMRDAILRLLAAGDVRLDVAYDVLTEHLGEGRLPVAAFRDFYAAALEPEGDREWTS